VCESDSESCFGLYNKAMSNDRLCSLAQFICFLFPVFPFLGAGTTQRTQALPIGNRLSNVLAVFECSMFSVSVQCSC
jgi:hypothetical protein